MEKSIMKKVYTRFSLLFAAAALVGLAGWTGAGQAPPPKKAPAPQNSGTTASPGQEGWPREVKSGDTTFKVYQPQLESWDGARLSAYAAIEVKEAGSDKPTYGTALATARTEVDRVTRMVSLEDVQIPKVSFPSAPDKEGLYLRILQNSVMPKVRRISLDRLEAELAITDAQSKVEAMPLKNDPPRIVFSTVPAIPVLIDGNPAYRPGKETRLERVINTRVLILRESSGKHYLHVFDGWMEAPAITGPWTVCKKPGGDLEKAMKDAIAGGQVDLLEGQGDPDKKDAKPSLAKGPVPTIHVATSPMELIVTEGDPKFVPIAGTALVYAENTTGNLFKHTTENKIYVLLSGRWFRSASMNGPWEFVPFANLPLDFPRIPDDSPKENVKASIPDTPQAKEAVIANSIPQTAVVNRKNTKLTPPRFDGEPQFKPVEGTSLQYAVNTATAILRVDEKTFYAVENGIWFKASSVKGPWEVADSIPTAIYSIPPSSPMHYVSYVKVYSSNAETVTVGYTPGYYGTCITHGSGYVAVYGTGYYYTPWVGSVWFGPPMTYGFGSCITYTPWSGWSFSFGYGWSWGYPMYPMGWGWGPYPWWGPIGWGYYYPYPYYRPPYYGGVAWGPGGAVAWGPGGWAATTGNVYSRWGSTQAVTRTSQGYNAWTGNKWANQVGTAYNSRTGTIAAGQRAAVGNVYTGDYAYGKRGVAYNPNTGQAVKGGSITAGNANSGQSGTATWLRGNEGGVAKIGDDIYAGKDGTVYRKGENGWEQNSGSGWSSANRPNSTGAQTTSGQTRPAPGTQPQTRPAPTTQPQIQQRPAPTTMPAQTPSLNQQMSRSQMPQYNTTRSLDQQQAARSAGQARTQNFNSGAYRSAGGAPRGGGYRRR
jgi:hypothetical protein